MTVLELILTALGSAGFSAVLVKLLHRTVDQATAEKIKAEAAAIAVKSAGDLLDDYRRSDARKTALIEELERRVDKLEERERHMLTRAAVHEAWDQLAFQFIAGHDASFPPPPPLAHRPAITQAADTPDDN